VTNSHRSRRTLINLGERTEDIYTTNRQLMKYAEYTPAQPLKNYVDAYWVLETDAIYQPVSRKFFVDGTSEILVNMGTSTPYLNGVTPLAPGNIYIGGTITRPNEVLSVPNSSFVGIRFKPGGISVFYNLPYDEIVDRVIEFHDKHLFSIVDIDAKLPERLDRFFYSKMYRSNSQGAGIAKIIESYKGIVSVDLISKKHNVSTRTLERIFQRSIGIPPKELINIVRFDHVRKRIQADISDDSLLRIAYEAGYYDHAHLTREFKKYSGLTPSEIKKWTVHMNHISLNL
jgi:AraC-like DNA-binding protein